MGGFLPGAGLLEGSGVVCRQRDARRGLWVRSGQQCKKVGEKQKIRMQIRFRVGKPVELASLTSLCGEEIDCRSPISFIPPCNPQSSNGSSSW